MNNTPCCCVVDCFMLGVLVCMFLSAAGIVRNAYADPVMLTESPLWWLQPQTIVMVQARKDESTGRQFFIDHNSRKTTWVRPKAQPPSSMDIPAPNSVASGNEPADEAAAESSAAAEQVDALAAGSSTHQEEFGLFGLGLDEVCDQLLTSILRCLTLLHVLMQSLVIGRFEPHLAPFHAKQI